MYQILVSAAACTGLWRTTLMLKFIAILAYDISASRTRANEDL